MTGIEWTETTWNPVTGCDKKSAGCRECYAIRMARRMDGRGIGYDGTTVKGPNWSGQINLLEDRLDTPLRWKKPRVVFVNSMGDLFHEKVPDDFIDRVFAVMMMTQQHTYQVLTKRPDRMERYMNGADGWTSRLGAIMEAAGEFGFVSREDLMTIAAPPGTVYPKDPDWPLPNVWLGTSVENQEAAEERIPHLLATPAAVRFLSCEPLLGPLDLSDHLTIEWSEDYAGRGGDFTLTPIEWVIVGGESGPNARPCDRDWIRWIVGQCQDADVRVFVKQLGANSTLSGYAMKFQDKAGADPMEWPAVFRVREMPASIDPLFTPGR